MSLLSYNHPGVSFAETVGCLHSAISLQYTTDYVDLTLTAMAHLSGFEAINFTSRLHPLFCCGLTVITTCSARVVLFSVVSVWGFLCLSVNAITPELLEILSRSFWGIILWSKGRTSSKIAKLWLVCAGGEKTSLMF